MREDEWIRVAMDDDKLVVDVLLELHQHPVVVGPPPPTPPAPPPQKLAALRLNWSVRQRRSSSHNNNNNNNNKALMDKTKKGAAQELARASPSTPLSWSGGSSAADGVEEFSVLHVVRSKEVVIASETPTIKRSRKKKTLAELKEEEGLLLKEKRNLTSQLEALRLVVEREREKNEGLKRIKLDLMPRQTAKEVTDAVESEQINPEQSHKIHGECPASLSTSPISAGTNKLDQSLTHNSSKIEDCSFLLPDLNIPVEEDLCSDVLYGTS